MGVDENKNDPVFPLVTGAMFPNCFEEVFNGFEGLSVTFNGPGKYQLYEF